MKILYTLYSVVNPTIGGVERVTALVTSYLHRKGHVIFFLFPKSLKGVEQQSVYTPYAHSIILPHENIASAENIAFVNNFLKTKEIDLFVLQATGFTAFSRLAAALSVDVKVVNNYHMYPMSTLELWQFNRQQERRHVDAGQGVLQNIIRWMAHDVIVLRHSLQMRKALQLATRVAAVSVVLSPGLCDIYKKHYAHNMNCCIKAISNPLPFAKASSDIFDKKENIVLYVGRFEHSSKRIDRLIEAWARVEKVFPAWRLVLVGGNDAIERERTEKRNIKHLIHQLGLSHIEFVAPCNPLLYYQRARIFAMTSSREGFGMTLLEAMSQRCVPIVFGSFPAAFDMVDDGINGNIVKPFNIDGYAKAMAALMADDAKCQAMAHAAAEKAQFFCLDAIGEHTEAFYKQLIKR